MSPPVQPAVQTSTGSATVHFVTLHLKTSRYLASYRSVLKTLGFVGSNEAIQLPGATLTFEHSQGIDRAAVDAAFSALQAAHLAKDYDFPNPPGCKGPLWFKYELWMQYKKEISIWAD